MLEQKIGGRYIREWKRNDNKANLVIIHGVAEHSGRYIHAGSYFHERGFNVYTGDLVGHGLSDGQRVLIRSADEYIEDLNFFIKRIKDSKPTFILGHSMGGFIALYYGVKYHNPGVKGLIVSSPYLKERLDIPAGKLLLGRMMARLYPGFALKSGIMSSMLCRDSEVCREYEEDSLITDTVTVGWFAAMEKARKYTLENVQTFHYPCLMLQAGADVVVDPNINKNFFDSIPVKDKEFELYKDFYHEILNDPEKDKVFGRICQWIEKRV